jgi:hypothetical protein
MITMLRPFLVTCLLALCAPVLAQVPSYDELNFESDSITVPFHPSGKNYAFLRSKRGTSGLNKTGKADSIVTLPVNEIVLVFSELNSSAIEEREEANRERWENLMLTYPEFFQFSTTYKAVCQCNNEGDDEAFKKVQGFYVFYTPAEPSVAEKSAVKASKPAEAPVVTTRAEEKKPAVKNLEEKKPEDKKVPENTSPGESATSSKPVPASADEPAKEKEAPKSNALAGDDEEETPAVAPKPKKARPAKTPALKPRKAKDPRACGSPCYGESDDDLNTFFKDNITLTKKQKRKGKKLNALVKLQLNFDGTIKNSAITGENEVLNQQLAGAVKLMNNWNPAVKNGTTIKSEVKITVKYDRETKALKAFEVASIPRLGPKCKCLTPSDLN